MQREFFICAFQSSFLRLYDVSMFQKYSCQVSKPSDVSGGIFSKRVTDDDDRRKTFFLASCSEYSSLIYRVVTMEYRTGDRGNACISSESLSASFLQLSFDQQIPWFFIVLLELRTVVPDHLVAIRLFFKAKEQLFEHTFCHLIFPVRDKSIFDSLWKSPSPVSTSEIEFTSCRSRRGNSHTRSDHVLSVHKEW